MAHDTNKKRVIGSLLSAFGAGGQVLVERKSRGRGRQKKGSVAEGCAPCTAVKRAAKMLNNKRYFGN